MLEELKEEEEENKKRKGILWKIEKDGVEK